MVLEARKNVAPVEVGPPRWFVVATVVLTTLMLYMAVAETTAWSHYFIDQGEYIALIGLGVVALTGGYLYFRQRLKPSLPLFLPWFLYPVITQGDQLIDNMTINQMRVAVHLILALMFAAPVAVLVLGARQLLTPGAEPRPPRWWTGLFPGLRLIERGKTSEGVLLLTLALLLIELWVAQLYLGTLMVVTLATMGICVLFIGSFALTRPSDKRPRFVGIGGERLALGALVTGLVLSFGLYLVYKNLPTSQQGTVAHSQSVEEGVYGLDHLLVPVDNPQVPGAEAADHVRQVLADYSRAIDGLFRAYYILDRNYNYWFHNELFMRNTPVLPEFRRLALERIAEMRKLATATTAHLEEIEPLLPADGGVAAFLHEIHNFVEHNFERSAKLARMSAEFEMTRAGLQHATHLYEGEAKRLGLGLMEVLAKHRAVTESGGIGSAFDSVRRSEP